MRWGKPVETCGKLLPTAALTPCDSWVSTPYLGSFSVFFRFVTLTVRVFLLRCDRPIAYALCKTCAKLRFPVENLWKKEGGY